MATTLRSPRPSVISCPTSLRAAELLLQQRRQCLHAHRCKNWPEHVCDRRCRRRRPSRPRQQRMRSRDARVSLRHGHLHKLRLIRLHEFNFNAGTVCVSRPTACPCGLRSASRRPRRRLRTAQTTSSSTAATTAVTAVRVAVVESRTVLKLTLAARLEAAPSALRRPWHSGGRVAGLLQPRPRRMQPSHGARCRPSRPPMRPNLP